MAQSKEVKSMASLLECPICLGPYRDPRMLTNCCHTLCYKCLSDLISSTANRGTFLCPVCRKTLQIPRDGPDAFQKNFFVNSCMDAVKSTEPVASTSNAGQAADADEEDGMKHEDDVCSNSEDLQCKTREQFCLVCCEYYCKTCSRVHRKSKLGSSHAQIAVGDLTDEMKRDAMSKSEAPRCLKHKDKLLDLYCRQCQCAVCYICSQVIHKSHTIQEITDVDEAFKTELGGILTTLGSLFEDVKKQTHVVDSLQTFVNDLLKRGTVYNRLANLPEVRRRFREFQTAQVLVDTATQAETTTSVDLAKYLDVMVLKRNIKLNGPGSTDKTLMITVNCHIEQRGVHTQRRILHTNRSLLSMRERPIKPKLCVMMYREIPGFGPVSSALRVVKDEIECDANGTDSKEFDPLATDRPQLDIICCEGKNISSLLKKYNINETTAALRNLVLVHESRGGNLQETRRVLGEQHCRFFKHIVSYNLFADKTVTAAEISMTNFLRGVVKR